MSDKKTSGEQRDFLFSFIIPAYNVRLADAVESVIAQSLGFAEHIQIVLVNDGSTDDTLARCEEFRKRFPDNIVVLDQAHGGVASARNAGLHKAAGRYIGFLDADDAWDPGACAAALEFFEQHPAIKVACFPITLFGAIQGEYWLNYKFGKSVRAANIIENPICAVLGAAGCFFRAEAVRDRLFDEALPLSEDLSWIIKLLLEERDFGLLALDGPRYRYRQHADQTTVLEAKSLPRYLEVPRRCHLELLRSAEERYGEAPVWVQYAVMLDLTLRIKEKDTDRKSVV